jgi:hypothetical protein
MRQISILSALQNFQSESPANKNILYYFRYETDAERENKEGNME